MIIRTLYECLETLLVSLLIVILLTLFVFQPAKVYGFSMEPTMTDGDTVIVSKLTKTLKLNLKYGDIVIIDSRVERPHSFGDDLEFALKYNKISSLILKQPLQDNYFIKRVIGQAGDTLEFKDGLVYRNGLLVTEPYIKEKMKHTPNQKLTVPANHIFVMGDNRNHSTDSRVIGPIPADNIMGKTVLTL